MNERVAQLFARASRVHDNAADARCWWVPGRIEVLGKHTDYAGGRSVLCAAEYGFAVMAIPRNDRLLCVVDAVTGERIEVEISTELAPRPGHWSNYPITVARRIAQNFPGPVRGVDLGFASNLPIAAGLSSSSAFVVATFLVLADANDLFARSVYRDAIATPEHLAEYLGAVENGRTFGALTGARGVGTAGGSQDHTAILCSRDDTLIQVHFAPVRQERAIALPDDLVFVVAASGVPAEKTGAAMSHYNEAADRASAVLDIWRAVDGCDAPSLGAALEESSDAFDRIDRALCENAHPRFARASLRDRLRQFYDESMIIIPAAVDALARADLQTFGALVDQSHAGAERWLGNQVPETVVLARSARELGAVAASAFGAGFGGSVYALVRTDGAEEFREKWSEQYHVRFPERAAHSSFFMSRAGPSAKRYLEIGRGE